MRRPERINPACEPCQQGDHDGCWALTSDARQDECACLGLDLHPHDSDAAWRRAMDGA